jgi:hypothetical protein
MAHLTWGIATDQPISAVGNQRRHRGLRAFGIRRGRQSAFSKWTYGRPQDLTNGQEVAVKSATFPFLDLPIEIRRIIYGYLLVQNTTIVVGTDWQSVQFSYPLHTAILLVNKQIMAEGSQYLYQSNTLHALVRTVPKTKNCTQGIINKDYIKFFKNVVVECTKDLFSSLWLKSTAECIKVLHENNTVLDSLTLVVTPRSALKMPKLIKLPPHHDHGQCILRAERDVEREVINYLDFFDHRTSKIMRIIPKLHCKVFNIVVRVNGVSGRNRVVVTFDLTALPINRPSGWLAKEQAHRLVVRQKAQDLSAQLKDLKQLVQDIYEDPERVVQEGRARFMGEKESLRDGLLIAIRGWAQEVQAEEVAERAQQQAANYDQQSVEDITAGMQRLPTPSATDQQTTQIIVVYRSANSVQSTHLTDAEFEEITETVPQEIPREIPREMPAANPERRFVHYPRPPLTFGF